MSIEGVVVPNLTPMDPTSERVDLEGVAGLSEWLVAKGVNALFINGTTGEAPLLTTEERKAVVEAVLDAVHGRLPVIVHIGTASTRESLDLADHAAQAGADALACVTPYYFGYTEAQLERFYLTLAEATAPLPFYLYSIPSRTGNTVTPALAERLSQVPNIVGIKDSSGDLAQLLNLLAIPDFAVIPGADHLAVQCLQAGAAGFVSGPAGVFPELYVELWKAWRAQDHRALLEWQCVMLKVLRLVAYGARIDLLKALAAARMSGMGSVRPPQTPVDPAELRAVASGISRLLAASALPPGAYAFLDSLTGRG